MPLGEARIGDVCQIHIVGNIASPKKKSGLFSCCPASTEFIDTMHMQKRVTVEIKEDYIKGYEGLYRGLNEALKTMTFGEESSFYIPSELAFGSEGLSKAHAEANNSDHTSRNPGGTSFLNIGPDEDLIVDIVFFRVCRDNAWHNRAIKNSNSFLNSGYHASM